MKTDTDLSYLTELNGLPLRILSRGIEIGPAILHHSNRRQCELALRGGRPRGRTRHSPTNSTHYWEPQVASHCQIHAFNTYLGFRALDLYKVLEFSVKLNTHVRASTQQHWTLDGNYFHSSTGNYTVPLINFYLATKKSHLGYITGHQNSRTYIPHYTPATTETSENYSAGILLGSSREQVLQRIPPHCSRFMLHYNAGYGHAKTLKLHNGEWWDLDSENMQGPKRLHSSDWQHLQGHIYVLTHTTLSFQAHPFQPELYYKPNNHTTTTDPDPEPEPEPEPEPTHELARAASIALVSTDEEPSPKRKKTRTSRRQAPTSRNKSPTTKSHSPTQPQTDNTQSHATTLPTPSRPVIPDGRRMRQSRIFGAGSPTKKPTLPRPTKPLPPTKRTKTDHTTLHPVFQQQTILHTTNTTTVNCRGIGSSWEMIYDHIRTNKNDIVILNETKLTSNRKSIMNMIKKDMPDYHFHHSSKTIQQATNANNTITHSAGVITLIKKTLTTHPINHEVPTEIAGHLTHQTINNTTHILGVYMPCNDPTKRAAIYNHIHYIISKNPTHQYIAGGDWNAVYYPTDRSSTTNHPEDYTHQQHFSKYLIKLQPSPRPHTYYTYTDNHPYSSRIDDIILINPPLGTTVTEVVHQMGDTLDHMALEHHITSALFPPPNLDTPPTDPTPQLQLPLKQQDMAKAREAIS